VRYERLEIQGGTSPVSLALHPRLTVIAGVGSVERDELVDGLIGTLGGTRTGIKAEITLNRGRRLAVIRPQIGRNCVVDMDIASDVTQEFTTGDGQIDLIGLGEFGLHRARRRMRLGAADVAAATKDSAASALVRMLADVEPDRLWAAADRMRRTEDDLRQVAEATGSTPEEAAAIDKVEQRHHELEAAQRRHERLRRTSIGIALTGAGCALPALFFNRGAAIALLLSAVVGLLGSFVFRSRTQRAARAQTEALADAGAESYLGFRLQPVKGLLSSDQNRKRLMDADEEHSRATTEWQTMAGDIEVDWALEHREQITAAARLRHDMTALGAVSSTAPDMDDDRTIDLARALVGRLEDLRQLGRDGERYPLILDDPFVGLDLGLQSAVLDLLGHLSESLQIIFLTEDEDVLSWARLEALTGTLSIVEPTQEPAVGVLPA
jgi:hypothetical protein